MARVYKPTFTIPIPADAQLIERNGARFARFRRHGKTVTAPVTKAGKHAGQRVTVEARCYAVEYTDAAGHVRRVKGFRDKAATEAKAAEIERTAERQRARIYTQAELDVSAKLAAGIAEHVDAYDTHLQAAGVSEKHRRETFRRLRTIVNACGFDKLADIATGPVEAWLTLREREGMSARTRNTYTGSLRAFVAWCIDDRRMTADPLATLKPADESADVRRERRALTEPELANLLHVAELRPLAEYGRESVRRPKQADGGNGKPGPLAYEALTLANIDAAAASAADKLRLKPALVAKLRRLGRERGLIYRTLVLTGLRRGELAALTWGDVLLDAPTADPKAERKPAPQPMFTVRASVAKNGKPETLPLRADLAAALRDWRTECGEPGNSDRVFRVPAELVKILARDLVAAGIARRVKAKDRKGRDCWRIDTRDADGRTIDVHALRTTTGSFLARGGVAPQTAQRIMRHGDYRTTLKHYTDPRLLDTAAALAALPSIGPSTAPEQLRATGTTDAAPEQTPTNAPDSLGGLLGGTSLKTAQNGASGCNPDDGGDDRPNGGKRKGTRELATSKKGIQESGRWDSNPRRPAWEAGILPLNYARVACVADP